MVSRSPAVRRRRLGLELRQLREDANLKIDKVAKKLEMSDSKISRIENGQVSATARDIRDMAFLYGVRGQRLENLMQLARETREKPWWQQFSELGLELVAYEAEASDILLFEPLIVPGLLQTRDYARAVIRAVRRDLDSERIERRVEFRMRRQEVLTAEKPPRIWAVVDEAILYRMIGDRKIMAEQLGHLEKMGKLPHVTIQVLPFSAGEHAGLDGPFMIIRLPELTDKDMVYLEHAGQEHYLDNPADVDLHSTIFDHVRAAALKPDASLKLLSKRAEELKA